MRARSAPPPRRTQEERTSAMRERLLQATITSLAELGYSGASTTDVCERAGVSRGAQLHHFPTKAALMAAAIEHVFARRLEEFRASLSQGAGLSESLEALWAIYTGETFAAWTELVVASRTDAALRKRLRAVDDRFFEDAKATCRLLLRLPASLEERRVAGLTRLILSVLDGVALNHTLGGREDISAAVLEQLEVMLKRS